MSKLKLVKTSDKVEDKELKKLLDENCISKIPKNIKEVTLQIGNKFYKCLSLKSNIDTYSIFFDDKFYNIGKPYISSIDNSSDKTLIVDGMLDYIDFYQNYDNNINFIVLNGMYNIKQIFSNEFQNIIDDKDIYICMKKSKLENRAIVKNINILYAISNSVQLIDRYDNFRIEENISELSN